MIKRKGRMRDRFGNLNAICPDGGVLSVDAIFMDARVRDASNRAPPDGQYYLCDRHGRPNGIGDVAAEARRVQAAADYGQRLANAHKRLARMPEKNFRDAPPKDAAAAELSPSQLAYRAYVARLQSAHRHV